MTLLDTLKASQTLYRQWRNLNLLCPDRLVEHWRIQGNNLVEEYEIFCASLANMIATQDPEVNPDLTITNGLTLLNMTYQHTEDSLEYLIVPKLQAISSVHNTDAVSYGALTDKPASDLSKAAKIYAKRMRMEGRVPMFSRGYAATSERIWMDGNLIASYLFSPASVHLLVVPKSLLEAGYSLVLPKLPDSCVGDVEVEEVLGGLSFSDLVSDPLLMTYSSQQDEYNEVLQDEYLAALRRYQTEELPEYDKALYAREEAVSQYMEEYRCAEYDIPASALPERPRVPVAPVKPVLVPAAAPATFETWTQDSLLEQLMPISMAMLTEMYDNYFSDVDIARVRAILTGTEVVSDELLYLGFDELQENLDREAERVAIRKYLKAESNAHLRKTKLGIKLMMEVDVDG